MAGVLLFSSGQSLALRMDLILFLFNHLSITVKTPGESRGKPSAPFRLFSSNLITLKRSFTFEQTN